MNTSDHSRQKRHQPLERLVPNPKLKFLEQCREVMRFHRLALRTEEAYLQWIKRFIVFHREKAEILKAENRNRKAEGNSEHPTAFTPWNCSSPSRSQKTLRAGGQYSTGELEHLSEP
jgi:hypothetical protein